MRQILILMICLSVVTGAVYGKEGRNVSATPATVTDRTQVLIQIARDAPREINGPVRFILELRDESTTADLDDWKEEDLLNWRPTRRRVEELSEARAREITAVVRQSRFGKKLEFIRSQKFWVKGSKEQKTALLFHLAESELPNLAQVVSSLRTADPSIRVVDVERQIRAGEQVPSKMGPYMAESLGPFYRSIEALSKKGEDLAIQFLNGNKDHVELVSVTPKRLIVACSKSGLGLLKRALGDAEEVSISRLSETSANPLELQKFEVATKKPMHPAKLAQRLGSAGFAVPISSLQERLVILATEGQIERIVKAGYAVSRIDQSE